MKIRLAGLLLALATLIATSTDAGAQATAPPAPGPAPSASAGVQIPLPTAAPRGRRGSAQSSPAPSGTPRGLPAPPQYTTLDGVWEVEVQTRAMTYYTHFDLRQSGAGDAGSDVAGMWDWGGKPDKKYPLKGTFDGRLFKFTVTDGKKDWTFTGYIENYSDIVGMVSDGTTSSPFTAQHRKKEKLINSINPGIP
jgi:hypothetical protein